MGHTNSAVCLKCKSKFHVEHDGGFTFHLLRCDTCGATTVVPFDKITDLHNGYLKGLSGPYCGATAERDRQIQQTFKGKPISERKYYQEIEKRSTPCKCGGKFTFAAPPRCPKCRSLRIKESTEPMEEYD